MKLLVSDFDGTITTRENDIKINCTLIAKFMQDGNVFALSSGRSYQSLMTVVHKYGIAHNYLSCFDGICTYKNDGELLWKYEMNKEIIDKLSNLTKLNLHKSIYYVYGDDYQEKKTNLPISGISILVKLEKLNSEFKREFAKLKEENKKYDFLTYPYGDEIFFIIKPSGINKSTSVEDLRRYLNIDKDDVFTVGDSLNDLEMIRDYNGYAIGDNKKLKEVAVDSYENVYTLINDIQKGKVKRRCKYVR